MGCCQIGSAIGSLPASSRRWPDWRPPLSLARGCYTLLPASSSEPATFAGTRTSRRVEADPSLDPNALIPGETKGDKRAPHRPLTHCKTIRSGTKGDRTARPRSNFKTGVLRLAPKPPQSVSAAKVATLH